MKNNPGYYSSLKNLKLNYPTGDFHQIEIDLHRTYPEVEKDSPAMELKIIPLRNVLSAFAKRNCLIGYQQGMNFLAARLLEVIVNEEETFWVFCQMVECIIPSDYFSDLVGVLIDLKVFNVLL